MITAAKTFFHGVVGGLSTVLSGGRFEQGFLAAGFTEAFSPAIAYAGDHYGMVAEYGAASVAGGVGSEIAGGRFQDGAVMGVFSRALNHGVHERAYNLFRRMTNWHYEGREGRNSNLPDYEEATRPDSGWILLSESQSIFHDNGVGNPELKFVNSDGREVIFDGDTYTVVTNPDLIGTYNYINARPFPNNINPIEWAICVGYNIGHIIVDVAPYKTFGNYPEPLTDPDIRYSDL